MMNFYKQQHEFYCGIDLHANSMHVCLVDQSGSKRLHRNFNTKHVDRFLSTIRPFASEDLVIGCESTFNWYWLADRCRERRLKFLLGHALYLKNGLGNQPSNEWSVPFVSTIARKSLRRTMAKTKGTTQTKPPQKKCNNFHRADGTYYLTFKDI
jgi:hypothetical protein